MRKGMRRRLDDVCGGTGVPTKRRRAEDNAVREIFRPGDHLHDLNGTAWKLGQALGHGGFGRIFQVSNPSIKGQYVAKLEPHHSGPLFVEINCYLRIGRREMVEEWMKKCNLKQLGVPHYVASGSHQTSSEKYRFLVVPKFAGGDLEAVLQRTGGTLNLQTVLLITLQLLDILEYIHAHGYLHCDIKASNLLIANAETTKSTVRNRRKRRDTNNSICQSVGNSAQQIYLLDYGLATKYCHTDGAHKEFSCDERRAHAGTVLFCSLDAHKGALSRRSDLESLGYNIVYWLTGTLPWLNDVDRTDIVAGKKRKFNRKPLDLLQHCFLKNYPKFLLDYFMYTTRLEFNATPDYQYLKQIFRTALQQYGYRKSIDGQQMDFNAASRINAQTPSSSVKRRKRRFRLTHIKRKATSTVVHDSNVTDDTSTTVGVDELSTAKRHHHVAVRKLNWSEILITDPERLMKKSRQSESAPAQLTLSVSGADSLHVLHANLKKSNPTAAMWDVYYRCRNRLLYNNNNNTNSNHTSMVVNSNGYTPAMLAVEKRLRRRPPDGRTASRRTVALRKITQNGRKRTTKSQNNSDVKSGGRGALLATIQRSNSLRG